MTLPNLNMSQFEEKGFCIIQNAISTGDILNFQLLLREVIWLTLKRHKVNEIAYSTNIAADCDYGLLVLRNAQPFYQTEVQSIICRSPEYYRLCSSPTIIKSIKQLLKLSENRPVYLTNNGIIFTNPNDESNQLSSNINLDWHKDTFYTLPRSRYLHVWAPLLHDASKEIGTLQVCPGSHKNGVGNQKINPQAQYDHRYTMHKDEISKYSPESIELKLGEALVFDGNLIHRSGTNSSKSIRCSLIGLHHDASLENFNPLTVSYHYSFQTPEGYFYELFDDEKALPLISEQAL